MLASSYLRRRKTRKDEENRRGGSTPRSFAIVRDCHRMLPYHHPSLINAKGEVCTQLPSTIHCHNVRTRTHVRTHACIHEIRRARVSYERRRCVELVQGIFETKKVIDLENTQV